MRRKVAEKNLAWISALLASLCLQVESPVQAQYEAPAQEIPTFEAGQAPTIAPAAPVSATQLRGLAEFTTVSAQALEVRGKLFPKCRMVGFTCMKVSVKNSGNTVIIVNGEQARADIAGNSVVAASEDTLFKQAGCGMSAKEIALLWGVGAGTLGLTGPILQEILANEKYPQQAFGGDAIRQRIEGERLGRRFLLPGDETTGWMCFPSPQGATAGEVLIPVYSATQSGRVAVRITAAQADIKNAPPSQ